MSNVVNPPIPYVGAIPGGFRHGHMITIQGKSHHHQERFAINLCYGPQVEPLGETALHFNPRFGDRSVVRNHHSAGTWGGEERDGGFPFHHGQPFTVVILCEHHHYKISVNGHHFCEFRHRLDKSRVAYLIITGAVHINNINYGGGAGTEPVIAHCPMPPPVPVQPMPQPFGQPVGMPAYPPASGSAYPAPPGQPMFNPNVPLTTPIQGGLFQGRIISISGVPRAGGQRFNVNLECGPYGNNVALHFDVRFNYGSDRNVVVRNACIEGAWGTEERQITYFPFAQNASFDMMILVEQSSFKVAVNNQHFLEFYHRIQPFNRADTLKVDGDVSLTQVRIQ